MVDIWFDFIRSIREYKWGFKRAGTSVEGTMHFLWELIFVVSFLRAVAVVCFGMYAT